MTQDEIMKLAVEAWGDGHEIFWFDDDGIERFAALVAAHEREKQSEQEPVAHMYPSDLEKFETNETYAYAYSVAVGNPDERSVPLYAAPVSIEAAVLAERVRMCKQFNISMELANETAASNEAD